MNPTTIGVPVAWVVHLAVVPPDPELPVAPPLLPVAPVAPAPADAVAPFDDPLDALPAGPPELAEDPTVTAVWPGPFDPVEPLGKLFDETG